MIHEKIINEYFEWLFNLVCGERFSENISYRKLLMTLHSVEFTYFVPNDENRASDGEDLRYRFAITQGYDDAEDFVLLALEGPCSVLEMMVALSMRCEENIMDDPHIGDRTGQWFWEMISSLGLRTQFDDRFDEARVNEAITKFLNRDYEPNGRGGLFTIKNCPLDMREIEIWVQMWRFIDNIA